jgi:hypothetical protein
MYAGIKGEVPFGIAAQKISGRHKCETLWRFAVARQGPVIPYLIATSKTCGDTVLSHLDDSEAEGGNLKIQLIILNPDGTCSLKSLC